MENNPVVKKPFPKIILWSGIVFLFLIIIFIAIKLFVPSFKSKPSELVWWGLWEDENIVKSLITEYESKNPGVTIKYVRQSPRDYRERLVNSFAKGEGPDIFRFHNTWVPMFVSELDSLPSNVFNAADFAKTFYPVASNDLIVGNRILGLPLEYDGLALFVNQDIFDKSRKTVPTTWDDLRIIARELTVKDDKGVITQSGVALGRTENVDHWQEILALMMIQNGVDLNSPTGKPAEDALTYFTIFNSVDGVWDATLPNSTAAFASGKLAMYFAPSWRAFEIQVANPDLKYKTYSVPQLPKSSPLEPDITYATYWVEGVWARSKNKLAAWNFINFLTQKDNQQIFFQNASRLRSFGEPYARVEMANLIIQHPVLGGIIKVAPNARSWYLASRTFDGPTGINSLMSKYFEDAVNSVVSGKSANKALETVASGVIQVLTQYKLTR